jgi:hypothetical protein
MIKLISAREIEKLLFFARRRLLVHARPFDTGFLCSGTSISVCLYELPERKRSAEFNISKGCRRAHGPRSFAN